MTGAGTPDGYRERPVRGESELTAQLISAAESSPGPLSQEQVDEILGVHPRHDDV
jgi:hypothetical protein